MGVWMPFSRSCRKRESPRGLRSCRRSRRLCLPSLGVGGAGGRMRSSQIDRVAGFGSRECRLYIQCRFAEVCDSVGVGQLMLLALASVVGRFEKKVKTYAALPLAFGSRIIASSSSSSSSISGISSSSSRSPRFPLSSTVLTSRILAS